MDAVELAKAETKSNSQISQREEKTQYLKTHQSIAFLSET